MFQPTFPVLWPYMTTAIKATGHLDPIIPSFGASIGFVTGTNLQDNYSMS